MVSIISKEKNEVKGSMAEESTLSQGRISVKPVFIHGKLRKKKAYILEIANIHDSKDKILILEDEVTPLLENILKGESFTFNGEFCDLEFRWRGDTVYLFYKVKEAEKIPPLLVPVGLNKQDVKDLVGVLVSIRKRKQQLNF
ncbi:MAG: hypothetical protein Q6368_009300 [Candidatus Baldrarchaeota archaeon]